MEVAGKSCEGCEYMCLRNCWKGREVSLEWLGLRCVVVVKLATRCESKRGHVCFVDAGVKTSAERTCHSHAVSKCVQESF